MKASDLALFAGQVATAVVLAAFAAPAQAQSLKPWRQAMISPKADAGFFLMAAKRGFAEREGLKVDVLDVKDKSAPKLIAHRNWCPPFGGGTHNALPLHDRDLLVVADEATLNIDQQPLKYTWVFDIREKSNPVSIATMPTSPLGSVCAV